MQGELYVLIATNVATITAQTQRVTLPTGVELQVELLPNGLLKLGTTTMSNVPTSVPGLLFPVLWCPREQAVDEQTKVAVREECAVSANFPDVLILGGCDKNDRGMSSVLGQDVRVGRWYDMAPMNVPRDEHTVCVRGSTVYVTGGRGGVSTVECFDTSACTEWKLLAPLPFGSRNSCAVSWRTEMYLVGGRIPFTECCRNAILQFQDSWLPFTTLPTCRMGHAAIVVQDSMYVLGGKHGPALLDTYAAEVDIYCFLTQQWTKGTPQSNPTVYFGAAAIGSDIYLIGGVDKQQVCRTVHRYDTRRHAWSTVASLNTSRYYCAAVSFGSKIRVYGGSGPNKTLLNSVEEYDAVSNAWTYSDPMPGPPRYGHVAVYMHA